MIPGATQKTHSLFRYVLDSGVVPSPARFASDVGSAQPLGQIWVNFYLGTYSTYITLNLIFVLCLGYDSTTRRATQVLLRAPRLPKLSLEINYHFG